MPTWDVFRVIEITDFDCRVEEAELAPYRARVSLSFMNQG